MGMQRGGGQSVLKSRRLSFVCRVSPYHVCCSESRWFQFYSKNATRSLTQLSLDAVQRALIVFTRSSKLFRGERAGPHTGQDHDPFSTVMINTSDIIRSNVRYHSHLSSSVASFGRPLQSVRCLARTNLSNPACVAECGVNIIVVLSF